MLFFDITGILNIAKKIEIPVNPKTLNVTQLSVDKFLQAISLEIADTRNINDHIIVICFQPFSFKNSWLESMYFNKFFFVKIPTIKVNDSNKHIIVGLILMKKSSLKNKVSPPKKTTAQQPKKASIGIFLSKNQDTDNEIKVEITRTAVPQIIPLK